MLLGSHAIGTVGVMAGVPAVLTSFNRSIVKMMLHSQMALCGPTQHVHYDEATFSDHGPARNSLVGSFLGDWLLMLDTDHEFEPDLLIRLLDRMAKHDLDVITGLYRFKTHPCTPVVYHGGKPVMKFEGQGVFKIDSAGAGCLLVKRHVFNAIEATGESPFDRLPGLSEDHSFFKRLEQLGIKAWCDPTIRCDHLRVEPVTSGDDDMEGNEKFQVEGVS